MDVSAGRWGLLVIGNGRLVLWGSDVDMQWGAGRVIEARGGMSLFLVGALFFACCPVGSNREDRDERKQCGLVFAQVLVSEKRS